MEHGNCGGGESELEQVAGRDTETARNLVHGVERDAVDTFFDIEDGTGRDACGVRQLLLREPAFLAKLGDALREPEACFRHVPYQYRPG